MKRERCGMSVLDTLSTPFRFRSASDIFYFVERILNERSYIICCEVIPVQGISGKDSDKRFCAYVLSPLQKFEQSESVGRSVSPRTVMSRTFIRVAYGTFPVEPVTEIVTFDIVAAWKTQKLRIHVFHHRHQILTQTVLSVVECLREQCYTREPIFAILISCDTESGIFGSGSVSGEVHGECIFCPGITQPSNLLTGINCFAVKTFQTYGNRTFGVSLGI